MLKELPEKGELVICTVTKAKGFGAFVELDEYPGTKGFIHIKEVAPGWVKNIRDHVREGQKIVCKVMDVDPSKGYVDLSLKRVNEHQKREKIQQWKNEQKAKKLLEMVGEKVGLSFDECLEKFGYELIKKFGSLYNAFDVPHAAWVLPRPFRPQVRPQEKSVPGWFYRLSCSRNRHTGRNHRGVKTNRRIVL